MQKGYVQKEKEKKISALSVILFHVVDMRIRKSSV